MDRRVWWATVHRLTEWDTTEVTALTHTHTHTHTDRAEGGIPEEREEG